MGDATIVESTAVVAAACGSSPARRAAVRHAVPGRRGPGGSGG